MTGKRVEVRFLETCGHLEKWCLEANEFLHVPLKSMEQVNFYLLRPSNMSVSNLDEKLRGEANETFFDPLIQELYLGEVEHNFDRTPSCGAEGACRPARSRRIMPEF